MTWLSTSLKLIAWVSGDWNRSDGTEEQRLTGHPWRRNKTEGCRELWKIAWLAGGSRHRAITLERRRRYISFYADCFEIDDLSWKKKRSCRFISQQNDKKPPTWCWHSTDQTIGTMGPCNNWRLKEWRTHTMHTAIVGYIACHCLAMLGMRLALRGWLSDAVD